MFETVVIATDGSDHAERAAEDGLKLAAAFGATVHVICVADTGPLSKYRLPGEAVSPEKALQERAERFVDRIASKAEADGLDVTRAVRIGPAKTGVVEYAESVDADLIVVGSRGRDGVERLLLGSLAEYVLRVSDTDVLVAGREDVNLPPHG